MEWASGRAIVAAALIVGALAAAPGAAAATRYAEPGVGGSDLDCPQTDPCDIEEAVEMAVADDVVVVLPGAYLPPDTIDVTAAITVRSEPGASVPTIIRAGNAIQVNAAGATVRDLYIESTAGSQALAAFGATTLERLFLVARQTADFAAVLNDGAVLQDSVAWTDADAAVATGGSGAVVVNVTAIGAGASSDGFQADSADGSTQSVALFNTIARGAGTGEGITALDNNAGVDDVEIGVVNSNYSSFAQAAPEAVVTLGSGNQTTAPQFASPSVLDFHQLAGSPTIDAGTTNPGLGILDLDFTSRVQGAAPDIGADEFPFVAQQPGPGDTFPPDTKITDGPKKKTKKRNVKFEFGGSEPGVTFQCQLDDDGFEPCTSPQKLQGLKRSAHVYTVRAVDAAGNADPSPADRRWRIKKSKRKG